MRRRRRPAQALRGAIDCMPIETRTAMRGALGASSIIVGAYSDRDGGVCPMLAAHRNGGRTSFAAFARAWDRYTRAGDAPRKATERELRTLVAMLDASIAMHEGAGESDLSGAIADHRASLERPSGCEPEPPPRAGRRRDTTTDRTSELRSRLRRLAPPDEPDLRHHAGAGGATQEAHAVARVLAV